MFPTRLNVMAPDKRRLTNQLLYIQCVKGAIETLLILLCLISIMLLGGVWILQNHFNDLVERLTAVNNQHTQKNARIKEINTILKRVDTMQREYLFWPESIADFANATPDNVVIDNARLNLANRSYTIAGTAKTRDDLLLFESRLETISYIDQVDLPLSQLTEKQDIRFSITASLVAQ